MTIGYHSGDQYGNAASTARFSFYGVSGTPTVKLDGDYGEVGGVTNGTMYPIYRRYFDQHKSVPSPLDIGLECSYDSTSRQGRLEIVVRNTTSSAVSGQLQVALCESHLYYVWYGLDSVHHVCRNMLPNATGEAITVPANDSVVATRDYSVDPAWVARNCEFVVFVQNNSSRAMYQGSRIGVYQEPALEFRGYQSAYPEPGADANLTVGLRNLGSGEARSVSGTLSTSDPYVTVTTPNASFADIGVGDDVYSTTPFGIRVAANCPNNHVAQLDLAVSATGHARNLSFPVNITTNRGFSDNMENGVNGWTHSGTRDNWHQSEHRSQSPSHAWYSGVEGSWRYTDENDTRLVSPYFTVGDSAELAFDHWYATEVNYDYSYIEINNGSKFWWPLDNFNANSGNFVHETYPLDQFAGQTLRCAFRFLSDANTNAEGWYVDDVAVTPYLTGVAEPGAIVPLRVGARQSVFSGRAELSYQLPAGTTGSLLVYDASGRLAAKLGNNLSGRGAAVWKSAQPGTYFAKLQAGDKTSTAKFVIAD